MTSSSRQHRICSTLGALILIGLAFPSGVHAAGINLSWDDCGTAGTTNQTFACNSNSGVAVLIGSFVAPSGITQLVGIEATLDIWTSADSLPSWRKHQLGRTFECDLHSQQYRLGRRDREQLLGPGPALP